MNQMTKSSIFKLTTLSLILLTIFGCANRTIILHKKTEFTPSNITQWQIKGKIAGSDNKSNWRSGITWNQHNTEYSIELIPSLSNKKLSLKQSNNWASLTTNGEKISGRFLKTILYEQLGWYIPISSLQFWIIGLHDPNYDFNTILNKINTKTIIQDGWKIEYKQFTHYNGYVLPKKIFITKKPYSIRIVINKWKLLSKNEKR